MKEAFIATSGLLLQAVVGFAPIFIIKGAMLTRTGLGRLAGKLDSSTRGITNKAKEFGENRSFYQRRQMARDARQGERRRANVEDYATSLQGDSWRSRQLRRRAAGGARAQIVGALSGGRNEVNAGGQQRILQSAEDTLRRQQHEETGRAAQRMTRLGIEGDTDLGAIAAMSGGGTFAQVRNGAETGVRMQIGHAEQQAAINALVQQGRVGPIRTLEGMGPARGAGGTPNPTNPLHHMLDEAYQENGGKLSDKAPDLMPNRRATEGMAAFTDLQPKDVSGWHHSTVTAAERYYNRTGDDQSRDQALRAFAEAAGTPATLASLSPDQVRNFRNMMQRHVDAGHTVDGRVSKAINDAYVRKGFSTTDPTPPLT